jgi:pyridoxamine 5'-phosphate oxidase
MIDPITRFGSLLDRARAGEVAEPTAMTLATVGEGGRPSARMVLLKGFDERGFVFYTNLESRKAGELQANPHAALCFHWQPLEAQVRIEGAIQRVEDEEADEYFASRPRVSQIGAWASLQSRPLDSFAELESRVEEIDQRFAGGPVPRPPYWSGYRVVPDRIEFWTGRPGRLHEREVFLRDPSTGGWRSQIMYP